MKKWLPWWCVRRTGVFLRRLYWYSEYVNFRERYDIAPSFRFNGFGIQFYGEGAIICGSGSYVGELSTVQAVYGQTVRIGANCSISHNVRIYTQSWLPDGDFVHSRPETFAADVVVGDGVWIGANAFLGPGSRVGDNSVIGANSVVTRDIPANEIWGGCPARLLRKKLARVPQ